MNNINITYIATKSKIISGLQALYKQENIEFIAYNASDKNMSHIQYLLLIEPFEVNSEDYAISKVWKVWLMENAPHVHLIVATFAKSRHSNFLNLADLPLSLTQKLEHTYPVAYFVPEVSLNNQNKPSKQNTLFDPWLISLPLSGQDMKGIMTRFVEGHDKANSYFHQLSRLREGLINLTYWQQQNNADHHKKINALYESIEKDWGYLLNRWNQYKKLMPYLPFHNAALSIETQMKQLENLIESEAWENKKASPKKDPTETLLNILNKEFLPYIYANLT